MSGTRSWSQQTGKQVRFYRKEKGITQEELAEMAEISTSFVGMIERGQNIPSVDTLLKIAQCLDVTIGELFVPTKSAGKTERKSGNNIYIIDDPILKRTVTILRGFTSRDKKLILNLVKRINSHSGNTSSVNNENSHKESKRK